MTHNFLDNGNFNFFQDPTNLQGKLQKHINFQAELDANEPRIHKVQTTGKELIDADHYANETIM